MRKISCLFLCSFMLLMSGCVSFHTTEYKKNIDSIKKSPCLFTYNNRGTSKTTPLSCLAEYEYAKGSSFDDFMRYHLSKEGFYPARNNAPLSFSLDLSTALSTDWSHWITDSLINVPGAICLFSFWSVRQKCDAKMEVFSSDNKVLKTYHAIKTYNSKVIGFIFSSSEDKNQNPDVVEWRIKYALMIDLLDQFIADYNKGSYDKAISQWEEKIKLKRERAKVEMQRNIRKFVTISKKDDILSGTGFSVNGQNIVTAYHLIRDAKKIQVSFDGKKWYQASLSKTSAALDIAVLQVPEKISNFLPITSEDKPAAGDKVFTFGYPVVQILGNEIKYSEGAISSLSGINDDQSLMQTTIPIQPGNSGSPLLNEQGEVIGMLISTVALPSFLNMTGTLPQNVNWAVKAEYISLSLDKNHSIGKRNYKSNKKKMTDIQKCICRIVVQK